MIVASKPTRLRRLLGLLVKPTLTPIERAEFIALGSRQVKIGVST